MSDKGQVDEILESPAKQKSKWTIVLYVVLVMVVMSIISLYILSRLAVPEMKKVQSKARMSEAKLGLASLYAAQTMHSVEYDTYTNDMSKLDIPRENFKFYKFGLADTSAYFAKYCPECKADQSTFKMVAVGNIDNDDTMDVWTIDQDKNLVHVIDDSKQ